MTSIVISADLGLTGALAILDGNGRAEVADMPIMAKGTNAGRVKNEVDPAALSRLLRDWVNGQADEVLVVVEAVSSMPGQGVAGVFSLGDSRGAVRGVIAARGYPMAWVSAAVWKRYFGLSREKELSRSRAIQLYPAAPLGLKKHADRAEALLIATYGWNCLR
jgi:crossover junction endodeoxyribonuclease RuvC